MEITSSYDSLSHTKWNCKYHVVFVPKCRRKVLYGKIMHFLRSKFHELAVQKGCKIEGGNIMKDHVHMLISIPPKYNVSSIVGYLKGKSAIAIARQFGGKERNFNGETFWAKGFFVTTVGHDADVVKNYIKNQEQLDKYMSNEETQF